MNENLAEMLKEGNVNQEQEIQTDLSEANEQDLSLTEEEANTISIISMLDWFNDNDISFDNVSRVNVDVNRADPTNLILSVDNLEGRTNDNNEALRVIQGFERADLIKVLNLEAISMKIFKNNTFQLIYNTDLENIFIKCYIVSNGLISVFCKKVDDILIPYKNIRLRRKDSTLELEDCPLDDLEDKLAAEADKEGLQILYKPFKKAGDNVVSNKDAINWLLERQESIVDVNHLLVIDNEIINIINQ